MHTLSRKCLPVKLALALGSFCFLVLGTDLAVAQSGRKLSPSEHGSAPRLYDKPRLDSGDPFRPSDFKDLQLPVVARGYCVVSLHNQQRWIAGEMRSQLVFDGQIYWFAGSRERDIFAAAPHSYTPALGGDCVVTFVETGDRVAGKTEAALLYDDRIFLFAGHEQRERFRTHPEQYANSDLARHGMCLVSLVDEEKKVAGLPETLAIVNGLRYQFAGAYQRNQFATNLARYGVKRQLRTAQQDGSSEKLVTQPAASGSGPRGSAEKPQEAKPLPKNSSDSPDVVRVAMEGYCPVSITDKHLWVRGTYQHQAQYDGKTYLLTGEKERQLFLTDPEKYVPALGGDCVATKTNTGNLVPGSVYHSIYVKKEKKFYLFAGPEQAQAFKANPEKYTLSKPAPTTPAKEAEEENKARN